MSDSTFDITIPPKTKRIKLSEIEDEDRLSDLPDCVILHILSFVNTKHAVQTSILSSRWKDLWKRVPVLILHSYDFRDYEKFATFMSNVLSLRDSTISLQDLNFKHGRRGFQPNLKSIVRYARSHNVQRLEFRVDGNIARILYETFFCHTLTHLTLCVYNRRGNEILFPKSFNLPLLTHLNLGDFAFGVVGEDKCAEPFSMFKRLNSLRILNIIVKGSNTLCITSETLVNLTLINRFYTDCNRFYTDYKVKLCCPSLCKFAFRGTPYKKIIWSNVSSLKHVDIDTQLDIGDNPPRFLFDWMFKFANIKSLTVSVTTLQVLSVIHDRLKIKQPSLHNLKSLRVKIPELSDKYLMTLRDFKISQAKSLREVKKILIEFKTSLEPPSLIPEGIIDFLLQNSPLVEVHFIDYKLRSRDIYNWFLPFSF